MYNALCIVSPHPTNTSLILPSLSFITPIRESPPPPLPPPPPPPQERHATTQPDKEVEMSHAHSLQHSTRTHTSTPTHTSPPAPPQSTPPHILEVCEALTEVGSEVDELDPEEALVPLELEEALEDQLLEDVLPLWAEKKLSAELRLRVSGESSTPSLVTSMILA
ncbi:hypothetical protein E2C01_052467 [Portunus trituberculatus]|uniref:Uncharacterized protein n=1 Tax=Portunus trituberculatus TaxID=210409 RepID=A0A5B7GHM6_PORTR|nr:hypothetical protein [Portunus trituberculatus]